MGMLIHHTWLEQQKQNKLKVEKPVVEEKVTEEVAEETVPVRKQAGRRKTSK